MLTPEEKRVRHNEEQRRYYKAHPERAREQISRYRKAHPEWAREVHREGQTRYRKTHPEKVREWARAWRKSHPERIREQNRRRNPEVVRERARLYRLKDVYPDQRRASNSRRRALARNSAGTYDARDIAVMLRNQKGRCWWCRKPMGENYTVDHRIALARGGSNDPSNLVLSCGRCNSAKHTKTPQEFTGRLL